MEMQHIPDNLTDLQETEPELLSQEPEMPVKARFRLPEWLRSRENVSRLVFLLGPWATYLMVEILNNNDPFNSLTVLQVTLNLVWYYTIFLTLRILSGRRGLSGIIGSGLCFLFGLANHYVLTFRGRIIFPCDLLCLGTAANVASDYTYAPDKHVWIALGLLAAYWALVLIGWLVFRTRGRRKLPRVTLISAWAAIAVFLFAFFGTPLLPTIGIYTQQWKTQANGFLLNFMTALRYSFVSAPDGYSSKAAQSIADEVASSDSGTTAGGGEIPTNLIVIMNESFSDLAAQFPSLNLSDDPLSYYHSLTKNTVKGTMISPVTGGGTANVEFEYLTGDSLAFLPSSTVAYQLYMYDGVPSMVSQAEQLGYHTISFHPYLSSGWNRTSVYPWMGFDQQWFLDDVVNPRLIRKYVSDSSDYEQLYRATQENSGRTFVFNVTMQNHSGYIQGWNNLEDSVEVTSKNVMSTSATSQYFSLIKESDNAIRELVEHYSASDERTMIVFFGDHQPPLSNDFYEDLYGKKLDDRTTKEVLQQYGVPFFIWANYDIPEQQNVTISSNNLGTLTAQLAGFPLTGYQKLHAELMKVLPVSTTVGFVTSDGTVTDKESDLPEATQKLYDQYRLMAYNHLFDSKHHPDGFYSN